MAHHRESQPLQLPEGFQQVLSMRTVVEGSEVPSFVHGALEEIRRDIERYGIDVQGPPFAIYRPAARRCVDVEVGWPVSRTGSAGQLVHGELPTGLVRRSLDRVT